MLTRGEVEHLLRQVSYRDWTFRLHWGSATTDVDIWIQVQFMADGKLQSCRKWRISKYMTKSEVVQTAFAAVLAANEHEVREEFHYRGVNIFGPHFDVDHLITAIDHGHLRLDMR